ncbi:MAG: DNA (cytosine-5-)-methyltransferase [Candidatus Electrothrix sp. ATG1]|nr:DNA (cytosine-5-)-methyltransferase [Candidatus Electrothrix sp. ATG1]
MDKWACQTLRKNRSEWNVTERDIHDINDEEISEITRLKPGEPDLLIGGPPCQPFSKSAFWVKGDTGRLNDPRSDTLTAYLRVLKWHKPKAFLMENVFGITYKGKDEAITLLKNIINQINTEEGTNYSFRLGVINSANYGVPQVRERVFIVGCRDGSEFVFPAETHCDPDKKQLAIFKQEPWLTAWDAIGDLESLPHDNLKVNGKWGDLLPSIPEGNNYLYHTNRKNGLPIFGWRTRYWSFLLKLAKNRPSWTIQAQPGSAIGPFHWKNRRLSVAELCRLQTFPEGYKIMGGVTETQRQLGNAVPSLIGEVLGREMRKQFFKSPLTTPLKLLPKRNPDLPTPEPTLPVADKYLSLVGDHSDHPGTGKGPMAVNS